MASGAHNGGSRRCKRDPEKHLTARIAVVACDIIALVFVIASGKRVVKNWLTKLVETDFTGS